MSKQATTRQQQVSHKRNEETGSNHGMPGRKTPGNKQSTVSGVADGKEKRQQERKSATNRRVKGRAIEEGE